MGDNQSSRRQFLAATVAVSAATLSGCGSGGGDTTTEPDAGEAGEQDTPEGTPEPQDTPEDTPEPQDTPDTSEDTPEPQDTPVPAGEMTDWLSYQVNSGNWGHQPGATGPHDSGSVRWSVDVEQRQVNSAPILLDGTLYVGDGGPADKRGTFYAIDAATGEVRWSKQLDAPITGGAATDGNVVFVGSSSGLIKAYRPGGSTFWDFEIKSNEVLTAPVVGDGNVYFGSNAARVLKFSTLNGTQKWTFDLTGEVTGAPAFADGTLFISAKDNKVYGVSRSGDEQWSNNLGDNANGVAVRDSVAYATSTNGTVWALNSRGRRNWMARVGDPVLSPPAVSDDTVYAGSDAGYLVAIDRSSGNERWRFEEPSDRVSAPPVVADGTVYFGSQDTRVYAVDAESGQLEWSAETGAPIDNASPVVAGGTVFIGSDDGTVYALGE